MKDDKNDNSIDKKIKSITKVTNMGSIDSISEKNEESSHSTIKVQKLKATKKLQRSVIGESSKAVNRLTSIRKVKRQTLENYTDKKFKQFKRKESKKKMDDLSKRISFQQNNTFNFYNNIKTQENFVKGRKESVKKTEDIFHNKPSVDLSSKNNVNVSRSESFVNNKYFNNKKLKITSLSPNKIHFKGQKNMHSSNLFQRLKNTAMFEKSENLMIKLKICYAFLSIFSFGSILLEVIDVVIYNKNSDNYLKEHGINSKNETDIEAYYLIEERTISSKENTIRIFNIIFSIFCVFFILLIQYIKINFNHESKKRNRYNYYINYNSYGHRKRKNAPKPGVRDANNNDNHIKLILNEDSNPNYDKKNEIILLVFYSIISIIFFPPHINKVFIGMQHDTIYVYSLNSIFLIISLLKIINIYRAAFYLIPFNNLLYKTICSSNMVKMNFKFMFKFILNMYPLLFIIINFITIGLLVSILIYCIEYFSIDVNTKLVNNKGINDLKDFYNEITLYCFFIIKNIHGNIKANTILGSLILLIGGTVGLLISSYFIYYINLLIEFKPEEQQVYGKLVKLLNPLNNEHKASNLIKAFLLMKKLYIDNKNIRDEYIVKKENDFKQLFNKKVNNNNFDFGMNESMLSSSNSSKSNEYKDKKKFLKFLCSEFIFKAKLINECKNFKNNLLIARNNSLSFNDVLKTLGEKMNANLAQLNNKIEVLIQNDQRFVNFMKFQEISLKNIRNLIKTQDNIINYLIEKNNESELTYFKDNKRKQENFIESLKNAGQGGNIRKMNSFAYAPFGFNRKFKLNKPNTSDDKLVKEIKKNKRVNSQKKYSLKKIKSSIVINNPNMNLIVSQHARTIKSNILSSKYYFRVNSFDDKILIASKNREKSIKLEKEIIEKLVNHRKYSLDYKKKLTINLIRGKFEI